MLGDNGLWTTRCGDNSNAINSSQSGHWCGAERLMAAQCLKRELVGDDIARVVLFLASDEVGAITSQQPLWHNATSDAGWADFSYWQ